MFRAVNKALIAPSSLEKNSNSSVRCNNDFPLAKVEHDLKEKNWASWSRQPFVPGVLGRRLQAAQGNGRTG